MNQRRWIPVLFGVLLIIAGLVFLLDNLGIIAIGDYLVSALFILGGVLFMGFAITNRRQWWAWIPGVTLASIGVLIGLEMAFGDSLGEWSGAIVVAGIGLSFLIIYLTTREQWWALIPGGAMLAIALMIVAQAYLPENASLGIFFLGLGATFAALGLARTESGRMKWPWIPAGILAVIGLILLVSSAAADLLPILVPLILVVIGGYLLFRALRRAD